jgi:hypothetical protein
VKALNEASFAVEFKDVCNPAVLEIVKSLS